MNKSVDFTKNEHSAFPTLHAALIAAAYVAMSVAFVVNAILHP